MYVMYAVMSMIRRLVIRTMELRLEPVLKICRTAGFARNAELVRIRSLRRNKIRITEIKKSLSIAAGTFFLQSYSGKILLKSNSGVNPAITSVSLLRIDFAAVSVRSSSPAACSSP